MTLQKKTLLFSTLLITIASFIFLFVFKTQLYDPFLEAEYEDVTQSVNAAHELFLQNLEEFNIRFADWSSWDDAYQFVADLNPAFIQANLNNESMNNLRLNLAAFTDSSGKLIFTKGFDLIKNKEIEFPGDDIAKFILKPDLVQKVLNKQNLQGIVLLPQGDSLQIAVRPILTSKNQGPVRGLLIMGRFLNDTEMNRLSRLIGFSLHFDRLDKITHKDFEEVSSELLPFSTDKPAKVIIKHFEPSQISGYRMIEDIEGKPSMMMRVLRFRQTYRQYRMAMIYFFVFIILFAFAGIFVALFFLHRFILSRLSILSHNLNLIQHAQQLGVCLLGIKGDDEIAMLTRNINKMLDRIRREIEEKQELEKRMVQSQKMAAVGQMAAGIAHEINNPISVIKGYSELGVQEGYPLGNAKKSFEIIAEQSTRCSKIVRDLLTFSRTGKNEKEMMDLNKTIDDALSFISVQFKNGNVNVTKDYGAQLPPIPGYKNRFQQVIVNLCNNAVDAMPQGGNIMIKTQKMNFEAREGVAVEIRDSGAGIPPEAVAKIFDPFFTTKEAGKGTGLGLSLVFEIIEQHQGHISVESEVDKGTAFHIFLPLSHEA